MAFKKVEAGNNKYIKYADCEVDDVIAEGIYTGSREGQYGIQHYVRQDDGTTVVLNSAGHLNFLLKDGNVRKGDLIQVTYCGTEKLEKGKYKNKDVHKFELAIDEDGREDLGADDEEETPRSSKGLGKSKNKREETEDADEDEDSDSDDSGDDEDDSDSRSSKSSSSKSRNSRDARNDSRASTKSSGSVRRNKDADEDESEEDDSEEEADNEEVADGDDQEEKEVTPARKQTREEVLAKFRKK